MLKITKAFLVKRFHKNSKLRRKEKRKIYLKYYSKNFLCWECDEWCDRCYDEYPYGGSSPGSNQCLDCVLSNRSEKRQRDYHLMVYYKYSIMGMTDEQVRVAAKRAFDMNEWYDGEIFGRKYIPRHITHQY